MSFLPALLSGTVFKAAEKIFNSPEHNFKSDLDDALNAAGMDEQTRRKIKDLLNTGTDQEIGGKLNALMAAGVIPPAMAETIGKLAESNGVSSNSIDPDNIGQPMDSTECGSIIGGAFPEEVDAMQQKDLAVEEDDDSGNDDEDETSM